MVDTVTLQLKQTQIYDILYTLTLWKNVKVLYTNMSDPIELHDYKTDHDILVELNVTMKLLREDVKGMKDDTKVTLSDHETRIRTIEGDVGNVLATKAESDKITRIGGLIVVFLAGVIQFIVSHYWH